MLKSVARKHSKQQEHHSPSGCAFLRGQLQVRGAGPKEARPQIWGRRAAPILGPRKLQPAPVLTQRPCTRPGKPTPQRCAHSDRNQTQKSHTLLPRAACKNQHALPLVFRRLKLCTAEPFSPLPPPVFNVANGNPRKAS